jgi:hypothetical protein
MGFFRRRFDPLDVEIIERVYEAAWARVETDVFRDTAKDEERRGRDEACFQNLHLVRTLPCHRNRF